MHGSIGAVAPSLSGYEKVQSTSLYPQISLVVLNKNMNKNKKVVDISLYA